MERSRQTNRAFTLTEVLVVFGLLVMVVLLWPRNTGRHRTDRVQCINNLKQVALAFRIWEADHQGRFPMAVEGTNGGTREWVDGGNQFKHFRAMSNELNDTKIPICPSDQRKAAVDFGNLNNENVSYFVGLDAASTNPEMFLAGDRNITNDLTPQHSVLMLLPDHPARWTDDLHNRIENVGFGNIAMADGSVCTVMTPELRQMLKTTGAATNRLALPE